jgi:hypothetical protein
MEKAGTLENASDDDTDDGGEMINGMYGHMELAFLLLLLGC